MTIRPEQLAQAVAKELAACEQEITDGVKQAVTRTARETTAELRSASPKGSGEYARGWKSRTVFESEGDIRLRVYNAKKPQLTHLLEFGHQKRSGGRVEAKPHIRLARDHAEQKLLGQIKVVVKG